MDRRAITPLVLVGTLCLIAACTGGEGEPAESARTPSEGGPLFTSAEISPIITPAEEGGGQPHLGVGSDGRVVLSWLEPDGEAGSRLRFAVRADEGWSSPQTVARGERFFVNWADVPSVVPVGKDRLAAHWLQYDGEGTYAYGVRVRLSEDDGRSWSDPIVPHADRSPTEHGFASFFEYPDGATGLVWLDGREMMTGDGVGTDSHGSGDMTLRAGRIEADGSVTEILLDDRTCECCPTTAVRTPRGVVVAYRDRSPGEVRDIAVVRYEDGVWSEPVIVHEDDWMIEGCPVNGPALAVAGEHVVLAWFTSAGSRPVVKAAFSSDGGASFGLPVQVSETPSLGRVDAIMLEDGSAVVTHLARESGEIVFQARHIAPGGARGDAMTIAAVAGSRSSGYPRMVRNGNELLFAWTDAGSPSRVRTAKIVLPGSPN